MSNKDYNHIIAGAKALHAVASKIRILGHIAWPVSLRDSFFANKKNKLPQPIYDSFDATEVLHVTDKIANSLGDSPAEHWLNRQCTSVAHSARMLSTTGTADFFHYSQLLYGKPHDPVTDGKNRVIDLARQFDQSLAYFITALDVQQQSELFDATTAGDKIKAVLDRKFADQSPEIKIVAELSANATASAKRIRLRQDAKFSQRYINQLIQHEGLIHFATSANGRRQTNLPILAISHPGTTRTQEGLAVFSEFITGTMDLNRLRRLADRVIAIQMAIDGADFIEVFRFFDERDIDQIQAYENTRRVFRGGVVSGGAPFTKDIVYLDGLLRVHNFLRAMVAMQRVDILPYLFCGKLDLVDIPVICELARNGICNEPEFLPDWAQDKEFLLSYLAYSSFLNKIDMSKVELHYQSILLKACPINKNQQ